MLSAATDREERVRNGVSVTDRTTGVQNSSTMRDLVFCQVGSADQNNEDMSEILNYPTIFTQKDILREIFVKLSTREIFAMMETCVSLRDFAHENISCEQLCNHTIYDDNFVRYVLGN